MENQNAAVYYQSCAVCRYQRKRCEAMCQYAPYFPPQCYKDYQKAHRLFGSSNIMRMVGTVRMPKLRKAVADSILAEGIAWDEDPVMGGFGMVRTLRWQIQFYSAHLERVRKEIMAFKESRRREKLTSAEKDWLPNVESEHDNESYKSDLELKLFEANWFEQALDLNPTVDAEPRGELGESSSKKDNKDNEEGLAS